MNGLFTIIFILLLLLNNNIFENYKSINNGTIQFNKISNTNYFKKSPICK